MRNSTLNKPMIKFHQKNRIFFLRWEFTLVEFLVAVSIVMMLLVILLPKVQHNHYDPSRPVPVLKSDTAERQALRIGGRMIRWIYVSQSEKKEVYRTSRGFKHFFVRMLTFDDLSGEMPPEMSEYHFRDADLPEVTLNLEALRLIRHNLKYENRKKQYKDPVKSPRIPLCWIRQKDGKYLVLFSHVALPRFQNITTLPIALTP